MPLSSTACERQGHLLVITEVCSSGDQCTAYEVGRNGVRLRQAATAADICAILAFDTFSSYVSIAKCASLKGDSRPLNVICAVYRGCTAVESVQKSLEFASIQDLQAIAHEIFTYLGLNKERAQGRFTRAERSNLQL